MGIKSNLLNQLRNPSGWLGRMNLRGMNRRHSKLTDWGLTHVSITSHDTILDIGCGGGRTIHKLAAIAAEGKVYGVDHSEASVATSRKTNRQGIETGRVEIRLGSVSHLPFPEGTFDLVTAVETHFYWPDLPADMREVLRVLRPGGTLIIITEAYKGGKHDQLIQKFADAMKPFGYSHLDVDEHKQLFSKAGCVDVQVFEEFDKGWLCVTGKKPS
jgi:SAM-dependent methyltransferase